MGPEKGWKLAWLGLMAVSYTEGQLRNATRCAFDCAVFLRDLPRAWLLRIVQSIGFEEPMLPNGRDHH